MALTRRITADTGSEEVRLLRGQVNALITIVEAIITAAETDYATFETAVEAIDISELRLLVAERELPPAHHAADV